MQKSTTAILAVTAVFIAGCSPNYDKLSVELQPCYTIQGKSKETAAIDTRTITRDRRGTHVQTGSRFVFKLVWLNGDREVFPRGKYKVENFKIANRSVVDNINGQLVALTAGETFISCTIILKCRDRERRFNLKEKVHVFAPLPPQKEYKKVQPLPMAVVFLL